MITEHRIRSLAGRAQFFSAGNRCTQRKCHNPDTTIPPNKTAAAVKMIDAHMLMVSAGLKSEALQGRLE
jgi:hypothetical protein